jgi:hypothetical protein
VTQETGAIKAQSAAVAGATASICNAEGARFLGSPCGLGVRRAHAVVAGSLCAASTPPRRRLGLHPPDPEREAPNSVNRP